MNMSNGNRVFRHRRSNGDHLRTVTHSGPELTLSWIAARLPLIPQLITNSGLFPPTADNTIAGQA
jgi:hypothetical protein